MDETILSNCELYPIPARRGELRTASQRQQAVQSVEQAREQCGAVARDHCGQLRRRWHKVRMRTAALATTREGRVGSGEPRGRWPVGFVLNDADDDA